MKSAFKKVDSLLKTAGDRCTTIIDGEPYSFYGIFDYENILTTDDGGERVIIAGSKLTVATSDAEELEVGNIVFIDDELRFGNDVSWKIREIMALEDGVLSQVSIVRV